MKDRLINISGITFLAVYLIWSLPFLLIIGVVALLQILIGIPQRNKHQREFPAHIKKLRAKGVRGVLNYDRNHPLSEWIEKDFMLKYKDHIATQKYRTDKITPAIPEYLEHEIYEHSKHGADELYMDVAEEDDEIASLYILNRDGTITRWTPPMLNEDTVDESKTIKLYSKVMTSELNKATKS